VQQAGSGWRRGRGWTRRVVRFIEPVLLLLLHQRAAHGYTLLEEITSYGLGGFDPSVVYRALREMEAQGWVTSVWDAQETQGPPRRVYRLTVMGDEVLVRYVGDLEETRTHIDKLLRTYRHHMEDGEGDFH